MRKRRIVGFVVCVTMMMAMFVGAVPAYAEEEAENLITPGAKVTASSQISGNKAWALSNIVDGNITKGGSTDGPRTTPDYEEWMQIELEAPVALNEIWLYPRWEKEMVKCFPEDFTIEVSQNGSQWETVTTQTGCAPDSAEPQKFTFAQKENVTFIKIHATKLGIEGNPGFETYRLQLMEAKAFLSPEVSQAEAAAKTITSLGVDYNLNRLILPEMDGFSVEIASSSDEALIALDGSLSTDKGGAADIVLSVTNLSDPEDTAQTKPIRVTVQALSELMLEKQKIETVTASSSHEAWPASHLIDGVLEKDIWASSQKGEEDDGAAGSCDVEEWAKFVLASPAAVSRVVLYPRNMQNEWIVFPIDFTISVSANGSEWKKVAEETGYTTNDSHDPQIFDFTPVPNTKYIRIDFTKAAYDGWKYSVQLAEVMIYADSDTDAVAQEIADAVTGIKPLAPDDTSVTFPEISKKFRIEIAESSDPSIVALNGKVTRPEESKEVTLRFKVTNKADAGDTGMTAKLPLWVESPKDAEAGRAAARLDFIELPAPDAETVTLPSLGGQYEVTIASSSHPSVVALDGTIRRSDTTTYPVRLKLQVEDKNSGGKAYTKELLVPIYKTYTAPDMAQDEINAVKADYERKKYGFFVHYVCDKGLWNGSVYADGSLVQTIDDLANDFDAEQFAKDMKDFGVEYVVLTVWHADTRALFPSMTNERWRDDRRADDGGMKTYSDHDMIGELLDALEPYGIDLHLYTHPCDGHDFTAEDQKLTGWNDSADSYGTWNQYINELYYELCERYGTRIKGLWFDGVYNHVSPGAPQARLRQTCQSFNPAMILTMNTGFTEGQANPAPGHNCPDYRAWEVRPKADLNDMKITHNQTAIIIGTEWFTSAPQSEPIKINAPEEIFRYVVAQASISTSGGLLASTGCYPVRDGEDLNGNIWQHGIRDAFATVNSYLEPVAESVRNTNPGKAFPSAENGTVNTMEWGVSTQSPDDAYIYLHVLNAPAGKTLALPETADGTELNENAVLMGLDGSRRNLTIAKTGEGYSVTLPEGTEWSDVDTVIRAGRKGAVPDKPVQETIISKIIYHNIDNAVNPNPGTYTEGTGLALREASRGGHQFDGWYDAETGGKQITAIGRDATGDIDLYARWSPLEEGQVETVTASPASGTYGKAQEVTLSCATDGAAIYYTIDGKEPTADSSKYAGALMVDRDMTIKAFAAKDGMKDGPVTAFTYKIVDKGGLQSLYDANKDKTQGSYTDESWAAFEAALGSAKNVLDDPGATQQQADGAKITLENAVAGLTEKGKSIVDQINEAPAGGTVVVPIDANGRIPADALNAAKGKDVNLVTNYGSYSWTVNGKEITGTIDETGYDLTVKALNDAKLAELAGGKGILQIEIAHNGGLPFKATLRLYVGTEHEGKTAHLYYYNEGKGALEYHGSSKVDDGYATFDFTHCSKYVITLEKLGTAADGGSGGTTPKTGDERNAVLWILIAVMAAGAIGGAGASRLRKRKQA